MHKFLFKETTTKVLSVEAKTEEEALAKLYTISYDRAASRIFQHGETRHEYSPVTVGTGFHCVYLPGPPEMPIKAGPPEEQGQQREE